MLKTEKIKMVKMTMELFDALPKSIRDAINYSPWGFSPPEIESIATQYAAGLVTDEKVVESIEKYAETKLWQERIY
jgi:hypothetical protein